MLEKILNAKPAIRVSVLIGVILAILGCVYLIGRISWHTSDKIVSGIVYNATFDSWPDGNTTFKVRASAEMAVTDETSPTYCLPPDSPYIEIVKQAAADKNIKVIVRVNKRPPHLRDSFLHCDDNTEVEIASEDNQ